MDVLAGMGDGAGATRGMDIAWWQAGLGVVIGRSITTVWVGVVCVFRRPIWLGVGDEMGSGCGLIGPRSHEPSMDGGGTACEKRWCEVGGRGSRFRDQCRSRTETGA